MNRTQITAVIMAVLMAGAVFAPAAAAQSDNSTADSDEETTDANTSENTTEDALTVGQRISGVIAMERAEIGGEMDRSQFEKRVQESENDSEQAGAVRDELEETNNTVREIQNDRKELREAYKNGSVSRSEYTTRMAEYSVELKNAQRSTNRSEEVANGLPEDVLRQNGVDVSKIKTLRESASELSGQEVSQIARQIAGNAPDKAGDRGNGNSNGNGNGNAGQDDASEDETDEKESGNSTAGGPPEGVPGN